MRSILVVCEGNICRSPMAQGLLAVALPETRVLSAGLGALIGNPADPTALLLMQERGIDITSHRAVQITKPICSESDLILVMDPSQRKRLEELYPQVRGRVFRVGEHTKRDIPDPYRLPEKAFRDSLFLMDEGLREWLQRIRRL
jgi:protein-tyrosine phosphatase